MVYIHTIILILGLGRTHTVPGSNLVTTKYLNLVKKISFCFEMSLRYSLLVGTYITGYHILVWSQSNMHRYVMNVSCLCLYVINGAICNEAIYGTNYVNIILPAQRGFPASCVAHFNFWIKYLLKCLPVYYRYLVSTNFL